jgi:hypothetical protein
LIITRPIKSLHQYNPCINPSVLQFTHQAIHLCIHSSDMCSVKSRSVGSSAADDRLDDLERHTAKVIHNSCNLVCYNATL